MSITGLTGQNFGQFMKKSEDYYKPETLENTFNKLSNKLKDNPNDEVAKNSLNNLEGDVKTAIQKEEAGAGDPKVLAKLEKMLENIQALKQPK